MGGPDDVAVARRRRDLDARRRRQARLGGGRGGAAITSSNGREYADYGCGPSGAIDQSLTLGWSTMAGSDKVLVVQLPEAVDVTQLGIDPSETCGDTSTSATGSYRVETSPDGTTWTVAATGTFTGADRGRLNLLTAAAGGVRYARLTLLSSQGGAGAPYRDLSEFAIYGTPADTTPPETTLSEGGPPFAFSSNEPGTFECALDDRAFSDVHLAVRADRRGRGARVLGAGARYGRQRRPGAADARVHRRRRAGHHRPDRAAEPHQRHDAELHLHGRRRYHVRVPADRAGDSRRLGAVHVSADLRAPGCGRALHVRRPRHRRRRRDAGVHAGHPGARHGARRRAWARRPCGAAAVRRQRRRGTVACALDDGEYGSCATPIRAEALSVGEHVFRARAEDAAGNIDPTPVEYRFTVVNAAPNASLALDPETGPAPLVTRPAVAGPTPTATARPTARLRRRPGRPRLAPGRAGRAPLRGRGGLHGPADGRRRPRERERRARRRRDHAAGRDACRRRSRSR